MEEWKRTETTRLYLHPPLSESFYTLWREGKIIFGEAEVATGDRYFGIVSSGLWLFRGNMESFDFRTAKYLVRDDGIPVHRLINKSDKTDIAIESFASPERKSNCFIRVELTNNTEKNVSEKIGFLLRTGKECELVFHAPDVYAPYDPDIGVWKNMPCTWSFENGVFSDGERRLTMETDMEFSFDVTNGSWAAEISLAPGEKKSAVFVYGKGARTSDYRAALLDTVGFWKKELERIDKLPEKIRSDEKKRRTIERLTVQLLQCFCRPKNTDMVFARQGGLQRQIWTYESMPVLEALSRIGSFEDYIDPVIDLYFNKFQQETGEIIPMGIPWGMATGTALYSFANYAAVRGKSFYEKYRTNALKAFEWIIQTRKNVGEAEDVVGGLFPPMRSCDDPLVFQAWTNTDAFNVAGIEELYKTARLYGDVRTDTIGAELQSYRSVFIREWKRISQKHRDDDEIDFPLSPRLSNAELAGKFEFTACAAPIIDIVGITESDTEKILRYRIRRNMSGGGLYERMGDRNDGDSIKYNLDENGRCVVWYVCNHEYLWFRHFMRHGDVKRAGEILEANEKYAMTAEHYMMERYHQRNVWFAPWMPNASANGRTILMMLDYYGRARIS